MGTAILELEKIGYSLMADYGQKMFMFSDFMFWHANPEVSDAAVVIDKDGKSHIVNAGETIDIPGVGTVKHQK